MTDLSQNNKALTPAQALKCAAGILERLEKDHPEDTVAHIRILVLALDSVKTEDLLSSHQNLLLSP